MRRGHFKILLGPVGLCAVGAVLVGTAVWYVQDLQTPLKQQLPRWLGGQSVKAGDPFDTGLSEAQRERLQELLGTLAIDFNRAQLRRAGWNEMVDRLPEGVSKEAALAVFREAMADASNAVAHLDDARARQQFARDWTRGHPWLVPVDLEGNAARTAFSPLRNRIVAMGLAATGVWAVVDLAAAAPRCVALAMPANHPTSHPSEWELTGMDRSVGARLLALAAIEGLRAEPRPISADAARRWGTRVAALSRCSGSTGHVMSALNGGVVLFHLRAATIDLARQGALSPEAGQALLTIIDSAAPPRTPAAAVEVEAWAGRYFAVAERLRTSAESEAELLELLRAGAEASRTTLKTWPEWAKPAMAVRLNLPDWPELERSRRELTDLGSMLGFGIGGLLAQPAQHDADRVMIALELHRQRSGTYPGALSELVPSILKELPPEPVGAPVRATGAVAGPSGDWGYRVLAEPDQFGRRYLLYSFGPDRTDDGGRMADAFYGDGLNEPNPKDSKGVREPDHVFNRPRPAPDQR